VGNVIFILTGGKDGKFVPKIEGFFLLIFFFDLTLLYFSFLFFGDEGRKEKQTQDKGVKKGENIEKGDCIGFFE
jgi:hypothetical protein